MYGGVGCEGRPPYSDWAAGSDRWRTKSRISKACLNRRFYMAGSTDPKELYTIATLATFAGSSGAVLVLYNTFRRLLKRENLWAAFTISLVVSYVVGSATGGLKLDYGYFLAFLNGCLLFTAAAGGQEIISQPQPPAVPPKAANESTRKSDTPPRLRSSWFKSRR